jgi:hypothetical protein
MDGNILLVICLTVLIVVGVNGFLLVLLRRKDEPGQIHLFRQAVRRARDPWHTEDAGLKELSERVAALKAGKREEQPPGKDQ